MLRIKPRFVTVDDFFSFTGKHLEHLISSDDNESNQADLFLMKVEDHLLNWIDRNTYRRIKYNCLIGEQKDSFKKAILSQALYTYKNGSIALGLESGYDQEKGIIVDYDKLSQLEVCQAAINYLGNAGLMNLSIKNKPRYMKGYPGLDFTGFDGGR